MAAAKKRAAKAKGGKGPVKKGWPKDHEDVSD